MSTAKEYCRELSIEQIPNFDINDGLSTYVVSDTGLGVRGLDLPAYGKDAQRNIIEWKPVPWAIPSDNELDSMGDLLPESEESVVRQHLEVSCKQHFSATAATISFLQQLPVKIRMHIRHIVIKENHECLLVPQHHARGLIPFCQGNMNQKIETWVDLWRTSFLYMWKRHEALDSEWILSDLMYWIDETLILLGAGMPNKSYSLVFHGATPSFTQQISNAVKRAAALAEAATQSWPSEYQKYQDDRPIEHLLYEDRITKDFPQVIRKVFLDKFLYDLTLIWASLGIFKK